MFAEHRFWKNGKKHKISNVVFLIDLFEKDYIFLFSMFILIEYFQIICHQSVADNNCLSVLEENDELGLAFILNCDWSSAGQKT